MGNKPDQTRLFESSSDDKRSPNVPCICGHRWCGDFPVFRTVLLFYFVFDAHSFDYCHYNCTTGHLLESKVTKTLEFSPHLPKLSFNRLATWLFLVMAASSNHNNWHNGTFNRTFPSRREVCDIHR